MNSRRRRPDVTEHAERLAAALDTGAPATVEDERLVVLARALARAPRDREAHHEATKQRMLRAFELAGDPASQSRHAGSRDSARAVHVHTAEVMLADGGRVLLADIEPISPSRAAEAADQVVLPVADFIPDGL